MTNTHSDVVCQCYCKTIHIPSKLHHSLQLHHCTGLDYYMPVTMQVNPLSYILRNYSAFTHTKALLVYRLTSHGVCLRAVENSSTEASY